MKKRINPITKAAKNHNSFRLAINAKCFDCQGSDHDPCVNWRIANCECINCPLYPKRPHQKLFGSSILKNLQHGEAR